AIVKLDFPPSFLLASIGLLNAQNVSVWLTNDAQTALLQPQQSQPPVSFSSGASANIPTVFVNEQERYQSIEGFGASFTDSSAWLMHDVIPQPSLPTVMNSLFD